VLRKRQDNTILPHLYNSLLDNKLSNISSQEIEAQNGQKTQ